MPPVRCLVVDATFDNRIAHELRSRGRDAIALSQLEMHRLRDPELLPRLADHFASRDWLLVSADDSMPADHEAEIAAHALTLATIDPDRLPGYNPDMWGRDVIHRWAHVMQAQPADTVRRYSLNGHRPWRQRRRRPKRR